jgi:hypothetical protein
VFEIRFAAVQALYNIRSIPTFHEVDKQTLALKQAYVLLLHDGLNDDDEEIRELAAKTVSLVLCTVDFQNSMVQLPISASLQVCKALSDLPSSKGLQREAIRRMIGSAVKGLILVPSAAETLEQVIVEHHELFMVEKQNLYIDVVRESNIWRKVLKKQDLSQRHMAALNTWVLEGLKVISEHIKTQRDSPLGWSSDADTFAFVVRVLNGTDVVLNGEDNSQKRKLVLEASIKLVEVGQKGGLHPALLQKLERFIGRALIQTCQALQRSLKASKAYTM